MAGYQFEVLPVDKIELDLKNPRIAQWVEMYGHEISAEQMALALGQGSSTDGRGGPDFGSLEQSILTNKGVINPIVVNKQADGKYVVIEGNTRTLIYRQFSERDVAGDWTKIPALVHEALDDQQIDAIRLQVHLVGTREWDPYSKAKYLTHLREAQHLTFGQIVDYCGGNRREVERYIQAFHDMEEYYRPLVSDQEFDPQRFSAFVELQSRRRMETLLGAGYTKGDFAQWVNEGKFKPLNTIRSLPQLLENDKVREVFMADGAKEALKVLNTQDVEVDLKAANVTQLATELYKRINAIQYHEIQKFRGDDENDFRDLIADVRDSLDELHGDITTEER